MLINATFTAMFRLGFIITNLSNYNNMSKTEQTFESSGQGNAPLGVVMPRTIKMWEHTGWGDSIYFTDYKSGRIAGHFMYEIKKGDLIHSKMESGKIGEFRVIEIEFMRDPRDQFFGTAEPVGYVA